MYYRFCQILGGNLELCLFSSFVHQLYRKKNIDKVYFLIWSTKEEVQLEKSYRFVTHHYFFILSAAIVDFSALRKMPAWQRDFSEAAAHPPHFGIRCQISPRRSHGTRFMYLWLPDYIPFP